ncbi:MAG: hypothetical protein IIT39_04015 [Clostridia bacterium]|nr:hypothetical protein [Clostridia bacterium]
MRYFNSIIISGEIIDYKKVCDLQSYFTLKIDDEALIKIMCCDELSNEVNDRIIPVKTNVIVLGHLLTCNTLDMEDTCVDDYYAFVGVDAIITEDEKIYTIKHNPPYSLIKKILRSQKNENRSMV